MTPKKFSIGYLLLLLAFSTACIVLLFVFSAKAADIQVDGYVDETGTYYLNSTVGIPDGNAPAGNYGVGGISCDPACPSASAETALGAFADTPWYIVQWTNPPPFGEWQQSFLDTNLPTLISSEYTGTVYLYAVCQLNCGSAGTDWTYLTFEMDNGSIEPPPVPPTRTRIVSVFPPDDSPEFENAYATSTSFAIQGEVYVNESDFVSGMFFRQTLRNNVSVASLAVGPVFSEGGNILCSAMPAWLCPRDAEYTPVGTFSQVFNYPITEPGTSNFATTTDIQQIGIYSLRSEIIRPQTIFGISIPGSENIFARLFTQFLVVETNSYDEIVGGTIRDLQDLSLGASPDCSFDFFTPQNYFNDFVRCIVAVSTPAYQYVVEEIQNATYSLLSHAPWGYGLRVYEIITDDSIATTTLPVMDFDFSFTGTPLEINLTPWEHMICPGSAFDLAETPTGQNLVHEIMLPWWERLVWALWAIAILVFFILRNQHGNND